MTAINVAMTGAPLLGAEKAQIAERITEAFALVEVGADSPLIRQGFMVQFESLGPDDLWLGGKPATEIRDSGRAALITVRVMAGPWNDEMKAELFERVDGILRDVAHMPREGNGQDIWMTFLEVPNGGWGLGGRTVDIAQLAPFFTADRQERIRAYLAQPPGQDP